MNPAEEARRKRKYDAFQSSRIASISPPPKRYASVVRVEPGVENSESLNVDVAVSSSAPTEYGDKSSIEKASQLKSRTQFPSPMQLNFIEELPPSSNVECISLGSILGDPMIKECWLFNYLFDMDFVMKHFDQDTRDLVKVRVVHGSWKREDANRIDIENAAKRYPNIKVIKAYMPEMFGTHHTKAIVLFRHDDLAQVVILTANFIEQDFRMSQAIWRTPLLPLSKSGTRANDSLSPLGSGPRFKHDLLAYFRGYSRNATPVLSGLTSQLQDYDFNAVRGALIGSLPGNQMLGQFEIEEQDQIGRWGLPALKHILSSIPTTPAPVSDPPSQPHIIVQVSSIASVGEKWLLSTFIPTISTIKRPLITPQTPPPKAKISIMFPTAAEIRHSIDGYGSGASIHMKTTSVAQAKQLAVLKPMLCHWWSGPSRPPTTTASQPNGPSDEPTDGSRSRSRSRSRPRNAGRGRAAPHIKTYLRFSDASLTSLDWALMTSANLSTQAWGSSGSGSGSGAVKISSYELGVLVWPALWDDPSSPSSSSPQTKPPNPPARMIPVFGTDMPPCSTREATTAKTVAFRMPYDLPLTSYGPDTQPWCASSPCSEPDWMGRSWPGYG